MRKKLQKFSLAQLVIAAVVFVINYFFFHFVTKEGITTEWQPEPGKPFVSNLIGTLGTLFLFGSTTALLASYLLTDKEK